MERLLTLLVALVGIGVLWLAWRWAKWWLRRSIRVDRAALNNDRPTLLYFSSEDCVPCRWQQGPILASLRQLMGDSVRFEEYDATTNPDVARRYRVLTVPTTVVIAPGGEVVAVNYGVTQADKLRRQLVQATSFNHHHPVDYVGDNLGRGNNADLLAQATFQKGDADPDQRFCLSEVIGQYVDAGTDQAAGG